MKVNFRISWKCWHKRVLHRVGRVCIRTKRILFNDPKVQKRTDKVREFEGIDRCRSTNCAIFVVILVLKKFVPILTVQGSFPVETCLFRARVSVVECFRLRLITWKRANAISNKKNYYIVVYYSCVVIIFQTITRTAIGYEWQIFSFYCRYKYSLVAESL